MKRAVLTLGLLCGACGGSESSTHVVASGARTFTGVEAYSLTNLRTSGGATDGSGWSGRTVEVVISMAPGACANMGAKSFKANTTNIGITVTNGTTDPITAGTYNVGNPSGGDPTPVASVAAFSADAACITSAPLMSTSGTVTLSAISVNNVSGSLDVTLDDGTRLSGSFGAPVCNAAEQNFLGVTFACIP